MLWYVVGIAGAIFYALIVTLVWSMCVVASRADRRSEEMWRRMKEGESGDSSRI